MEEWGMSFLSKKYRVIFTLSLASILLLSCFNLYKFWQSDLSDQNEIRDVYRASVLIDQLKSTDEFATIKNLIETGNIRSAAKIFKPVEDRLIRAIDIIAVDNTKKIKDDLKNYNKVVLDLVSGPTPISLVNVVRKKIQDFSSFVNENKWRTLTRMSGKLYRQIANLSDYKHSNLQALLKNTQNNIEQMKKITSTSILPSSEKDIIVKRLELLNIELKFLDSYNTRLKDFGIANTKFNRSFLVWVGQVGPEISLRKISWNNKKNIFNWLLLGQIVLVLLWMAGGYYIFSLIRSREEKDASKKMLQIIESGMINQNNKIYEDFELESREKFDDLQQYIQQRMSFGYLFKEALPFPSMILDSNLKVMWANQQFLELVDHEPEEAYRFESLSWDFILQKTNLGNHDPIKDAFSHDISGIYQVQILSSNHAIPFEMYVTPTEFQGEKRIVTLFYSLSSMEETIANQAQTLIGPVKKCLIKLKNDEFDDSRELSELEKDFSIADTLDIFQEFCLVHEKYSTEKMSLIGEIKSLESQLMTKLETLTALQVNLNELAQLVNHSKKEMLSIKNIIIELSQNNTKGKSLFNNLDNVYHRFIENHREALESHKSSQSVLRDGVQLLSKMSPLAQDLKTALSRNDKEMMQNSLRKLDVQLSKAEMLFDKKDYDAKNILIEKLNNEKRGHEKEYNENKHELNHQLNLLVEMEERFIKSLRGFSEYVQEEKKQIELGSMMIQGSKEKYPTEGHYLN